jgi:hypothetical protein
VDHVARQHLVGIALRDLQQILEELFFQIRATQRLGCGVVGAADIAGVAGVAAAIEFRRRFRRPPARRISCSGQPFDGSASGIAA